MFPGAVVGAERHCAIHFMGVVVISFFNQGLGYNGSNEACKETWIPNNNVKQSEHHGLSHAENPF